MAPSEPGVWVFNGEGGRFPAGVFSNVEKAEDWIKKHKLSGVLTWYPIDVSIYDWVIANNKWQPKRDNHREPSFIQTFSSAYTGHFHYENGENGGELNETNASD